MLLVSGCVVYISAVVCRLLRLPNVSVNLKPRSYAGTSIHNSWQNFSARLCVAAYARLESWRAYLCICLCWTSFQTVFFCLLLISSY